MDKKRTLTIAVISDTHGLHHEIAHFPAADVFARIGDALHSGSWQELEWFADWLESLPYKHKIYVPGNHDTIVERMLKRAREFLASKGIQLLIEEEICINGFKIFGSPFSSRHGGWAFMLDEGQLERKAKL